MPCPCLSGFWRDRAGIFILNDDRTDPALAKNAQGRATRPSSLLSVLHKLGTTTLDGASYTYDNAENRKTRTDKRTSTTLTYGYDNIYQLQTAKQGSTTKESYT